MQNKPALKRLAELDPAHLQTLTPEQMRRWLSSIHEESQSHRKIINNNLQIRTKPIHKYFSKANLKEYIKSNISRIARRTVRRHGRHNDCEIAGKQGGKERVEEGKLNFKLGVSQRRSNNDEKFDKFVRNALKKISSQQLSCPICLEIMILPTLIPCGHCFCSQCIDESLLFKQECPNCRENIRGCEPIVCSLLDRLIESKMSLQIDSQRQAYQERRYKIMTWKAQRNLNYDTLTEGQLIDARDTQTIWCQATVRNVYREIDPVSKKEVTTAVLVHYNRWHQIYDQIIQVPSCRLAPLSFFSGRINISRYNLAEPDNNRQGSIISGPSSLGFSAFNPMLNFIQVVDSMQEDMNSHISLEESEQGEGMNVEMLQNLNPSNQDESQSSSSSESEDSSREAGNGQNILQTIINRIRNNVLSRFVSINQPIFARRIPFGSGNSQQQSSEHPQQQGQQMESAPQIVNIEDIRSSQQEFSRMGSEYQQAQFHFESSVSNNPDFDGNDVLNQQQQFNQSQEIQSIIIRPKRSNLEDYQ